MKFWNHYKRIIARNFDIHKSEPDSLRYWKDLMFSNAITFIIPLSVIAYIPGVFYSWTTGLFDLVFVNTISISIIIFIGFFPGLSIRVRKTLFIMGVYLIAMYLLYLVGPAGPGLIYLLAAAFFCVIIFPAQYAYYPAMINLITCIIVTGIIPLDILPWSGEPVHNIPQWIATSSNLVFLGFISSALIPTVFNGLKESLEKEQKMRLALNEQKKILEKTLDELKNKNADLEMFAFASSHDLQEPLRMITGFLTQLEKKYRDKLDEKAQKYIFFAVDAAKRMRQIILDLLDFSRIGRLEEERELVEVNDLIQEIVMLQQKSISEKSARIVYKDLPAILTHKAPLQQVFQNLISNGLKYSRPEVSPEISITAQESPTYWTFSVLDNGIGINPEYFEKIFVIFQRLHAREEHEGTGMGLTIVKKIVENLGGQIWLESAEGRGSVFHFSVRK